MAASLSLSLSLSPARSALPGGIWCCATCVPDGRRCAASSTMPPSAGDLRECDRGA
jgi:hypothetical protein